jgi:hypothetical protein
MQLLEAIVEKGWDDIARLGVAAIDPGRLSLRYIQISLKHGCNETAALAAQRLIELAAARRDIPAWLEGALTMGQIKHRINRDALHNCVRLLAGWPIEQVGNLMDEFVTNRDTMTRSFSEASWMSVSAVLRSYYPEIRSAIYEHIDRTARGKSESARKSFAGVGLGVALVTLVVLLAISSVFNAMQDFALIIVGVAVLAGVIVTSLKGASENEKAFREHQTHLRALQRRIERAIGVEDALRMPA